MNNHTFLIIIRQFHKNIKKKKNNMNQHRIKNSSSSIDVLAKNLINAKAKQLENKL